MNDGRTLERIPWRFGENEGNLISTQQDIENEFSFLREDAIYPFLERLDVPVKKFSGIATISAQCHLKPKGKNEITACCGTACLVKVLSG
jgi:NADH:ubiquinone oxidoreductase subunit E